MNAVSTCILVVVQTVHPWCHATVICQGFHLIQFELGPFWSSCHCIEVGYQLISLHMLGYVKAYSPEQTHFYRGLNTWKKYSVLCCTVTHRHSHGHFRAHSQKQTHNQTGYNATSWSQVLPDYYVITCQGLLKQQCVSYQLVNCVSRVKHTHTHEHCPSMCQGVGLGPTA